MDGTEVAALRADGLASEEGLHINLDTACFNFANRIALGLGVEASPDDVADYRV